MKIAVYDDNPDFGGHQIMACHGIDALRAHPSANIAGIINPANQKLQDRLAGIPILNPGSSIRSINPDLLLCIQGDIAQCTQGIKAARQAGIECVSYLALPHRMADMGAKLGALRDAMNSKWFNAPDRFITISESMKIIMRERGCTKPITVVPNGLPAPPNTVHPETHIQTIGLAGRIEFSQKQQDFMVRTFLSDPVFKSCRLLIVGGGPDEGRLRKTIEGEERITLLPWQSDMEAVYRQIDLLAIPSRYEGVPLVMLEALARGIPVIGSACDGMRDVLPAEWTFSPGDPRALATTFASVRETWKQKIEPLQNRVREEHSLKRFKAGFATAVTMQV